METASAHISMPSLDVEGGDSGAGDSGAGGTSESPVTDLMFDEKADAVGCGSSTICVKGLIQPQSSRGFLTAGTRR